MRHRTAMRSDRSKARHDGPAPNEKPNFYDAITQQIIAELEEGRAPWVQPWDATAATLTLPRNVSTGRTYSGINILILWNAVIRHSFPTQGWLTYQQARSLGGHIRKDERGTTVVYADRFVPRDQKDTDAGEAPKAIPFLKTFTVFNLAQCEDIDPSLAPAIPTMEQATLLPTVRNVLEQTGADVRLGGNIACYHPIRDFIQMPVQEAYYDEINWYRTLMHELGHWTGHNSRLNRDLTGKFGSHVYAREELCAEMTAAFCCAELGIVPTVRHADYLGSWLNLLREDNRAIVRAASAASKAANFILHRQEQMEASQLALTAA